MLSHQLMMETDRLCREYNVDEERRRELIRVVEACVEEYAKHNLLGRCSFSLKVDDDGEVALVGSPLPGYEDLNDGVDPLDAFARDIMRRLECSREDAELAMGNMQLCKVDLNDGVDPLDVFARDIMRRLGCSREEAELAMGNMHIYQKEDIIHLVSEPSKNNDTFGYILHKKDK